MVVEVDEVVEVVGTWEEEVVVVAGCVVVVSGRAVLVVVEVVDVVLPGQMKMSPLSCSALATAASPSASCCVRSRQDGHMPPAASLRALRL